MERLIANSEETSPAKWAGYTIDELRYRRAYLLAKCEISKSALMNGAAHVRGEIPGMGRHHGIMGKILGSLSYMDYAILAFRIGSKLLKLRRRHK